MGHRLGIVVIALLMAGCSSSDGGASGSEDGSANGDEQTSLPATTVPNRPPELRVPESIRLDVGRIWTDAIVAIDPDGDDVSIRILESPVGFLPVTNARGLVTGFEWQPTDAGRWVADIVATDSEGNTAVGQIELLARFPRNGDLLLAMGDSVAAGFGRDRSDFLGPDGCFRSEGSAYPSLVFDALVADGTMAPSADFLTVACSGSNAAALLEQPVRATDRDGDERSNEGERAQLDWAVEQNPTIITITVGPNDIQFIDPSEVLVDDAENDPALAIDEEVFSARLRTLEDGLNEVLRTIVDSTDAQVLVTGAYNPTAVLPVGVDECGSVCFRLATAEIAERLDDTIRDVVGGHPEERVTYVRIDDLFAGHEATNGFGPDIIRETDFGPFSGLVSQFTGDTFPYCSDGDGTPDTYVTRLDCTHPNDDGHAAIAGRIVDSIED